MACSDHTVHETMYFHGSHSDVGGGINEDGIANISLNWMAQKASKLGLSVSKEGIPSISYDDVMQPITDSYDSFLKGFYSKFEDKYHRKLNLNHPDYSVHPLTISRIEADESYRPVNLEPIIGKVLNPNFEEPGLASLGA
jgi:hypothetical protein